jgi:hypothetical protein
MPATRASPLWSASNAARASERYSACSVMKYMPGISGRAASASSSARL